MLHIVMFLHTLAREKAADEAADETLKAETEAVYKDRGHAARPHPQ